MKIKRTHDMMGKEVKTEFIDDWNQPVIREDKNMDKHTPEKCHCGYCEQCLNIGNKHTPTPVEYHINGCVIKGEKVKAEAIVRAVSFHEALCTSLEAALAVFPQEIGCEAVESLLKRARGE